MAERYHLTPEGPKHCSVDPSNPRSRGCGYGEGGHYSDPQSAEAAYAESMGGPLPSAAQKPSGGESYSPEELQAAMRHFSTINDLTAPEARALAHRLRTASEHSGPGEMYRGMTGYGGISGVGWSELQEGSRLAMKPRSWTDSQEVADEFSWDQTADEEDPSIKSVLIVADGGIEGVRIQDHSDFDWQNEVVSTAGVFVVDSVEPRDGASSIEDSESIMVSGHWETAELSDEEWEQSLTPYSLAPEHR